MNYFFSPFALVNQYQPYYAFAPQLLIETKSYYLQQPYNQKQISAEKELICQFERQEASKIIDQPVAQLKKPKKPKKKQDKNFGFRQQDKQRNIFSNILKGFFVNLTQKRSLDGFLEKLLLQNSIDMKIQRFIEKSVQVFSKCKSYFSPKTVRNILKIQKQSQEVQRLIKICLFHYLKTQFSLSLLLSNRIKRKSKILQMKKARQLLSILRAQE